MTRHIADRLNELGTIASALGVAGGTLAACIALATSSHTARIAATYLLLPSTPVGLIALRNEAKKGEIAQQLKTATAQAAQRAIQAAESQHAIELNQLHRQQQKQTAAAIEQLTSRHNQTLKDAIDLARAQATITATQQTRASYTQQIEQLLKQHEHNLNQLRTQLDQEHQQTITELEHDSDQRILTLISQHSQTTQQLEQQLAGWQEQRDALDEDLRVIQEWRIEAASYSSQQTFLESQQLEFESKIDALQDANQAKIGELLECIAAERSSGYESGWNDAQRETQYRIRELELENEHLAIQVKIKRKREKLNKTLPELQQILSRDRKPIAVEGSQGSGKALAIANAMHSYADGLPIIVLVLDISEASDPDSTWRKLGIPATDDPELFAQYLQAIAHSLPNRPHRNNRADYDQTPPVFAIVDEALCAFDTLDPETIKEQIRKPLRAIESRGQKRKCYPIVATQDGQIQNLKANGITLWNTGSLKNYAKILLNDGLRETISADELEKYPDLGDYIEAYQNKYVAAIETVTGRGKRKQPIKHPSHHNHDLSDTIPSRGIEQIQLAPPPDWMPAAIRQLYAEFRQDEPVTAVTDDRDDPSQLSDDLAAVTSAKAAIDQAFEPRHRSIDTAELARKYGLDCDVTGRAIDLAIEGNGITAIATALGICRASKSKPKHPYQRLKCLLAELEAL